jgi:superfamily II DNA or RNA helicase
MDDEIIDLTGDEYYKPKKNSTEVVILKDDSAKTTQIVESIGKNDTRTFLKEHQLNVLRSLRGQAGLLAVHRTGSGKTILGLSVRKQLRFVWEKEMKEAGASHIAAVIVAPTKVKEQYESEMKRLGNVKKSSFKFFNYESLRNEKLCSEAKQFLEKNKFNILIFDEAHRLSNNESALADRAVYIASSAKFVL